VGLVHHRAPPPNPYLTQSQAPPESFSATPTGASSGTGNNNDDDSRYPTTPQKYIAALNPKGSNARFCLKSSEDSVQTGQDSSYIPSEGAAIKTDLPGRDGEIGEEGVDNPGSLSTAKEPGNGTNEKGQISFGEKEPDLHDIKLTTVNRIVSDTKEEADYVMGQTDDPIKNAFAGEGIPMNKGD
jgi:hypothetical protein